MANIIEESDNERLRRILEQSGGITTIQTQDDSTKESIIVCEDIVQTANSLRSIDALAEAPKQESVEEARIILRWLRNMEFSDRDLEEFLDNGTPVVILSKKKNLQKLTEIFAIHLRHIQSLGKEATRTSNAIRNAQDAVDAIALEVAEHTRRQMVAHSLEEARLDALIDSLPDSAQLRQNQSLEQLLDTLELGLEQVSGKTVELSSLDRLIAMSQHLDASANALKSPDNLNEPLREESIELARDILRRMQNMPFGNQSLAEFIQHGRPEEKAAFAQQVDEVVGMYKNLLAEAAQTNPGILQEESIKNATDAVSGFAHSVKLMAAKEMPNSIASAQQIGAEAARDPSQWGDMHKHTVNRLLKSAEGGLEKAIEEVAQQQEDQDQDVGQEAAEQAMQQVDQGKRKKRRRKESKSRASGKGGKKSRKVQQALTADDAVLNQGIFAVGAKPSKSTVQSPPAMTGLKESDIAAIKELGGALRGFNDLSATLATVSTGDKIVPDDKTLSQRLSDREQQQPQGNKPRTV